MPYTLSCETLNPTHSLTQSYINSFQWKQFDSGEMACLQCAFLNFFSENFPICFVSFWLSVDGESKVRICTESHHMLLHITDDNISVHFWFFKWYVY